MPHIATGPLPASDRLLIQEDPAGTTEETHVQLPNAMPGAFVDLTFAVSVPGINADYLHKKLDKLCLNDSEVNALLNAALANPMAVGGIRGMIYAVAMDYAAAKMGSVSLALEYARAAVQSEPGSVPLRLNLVQLLVGSRNKSAARREFSELATLRIPPLDQATVDRLGKQLERLEHDASPR